jgi:titin
LDVTGTAIWAMPTRVALYNGAKDNIVGGTTAGAGNVIFGNNGEGVRIVTTGTTGNVGWEPDRRNAAGTAGIANNRGVWIDDTAANNTVGGTAAGSATSSPTTRWTG